MNRVNTSDISEINIDSILRDCDEDLYIKFSNLVNTPFFVGPLTRIEAEKEVEQYFRETHPSFLFKIENSYFCIYPSW